MLTARHTRLASAIDLPRWQISDRRNCTWARWKADGDAMWVLP